MTAKIETLYSAKPNEEVVHHLESLLLLAQSGQLQTFAGVGLMADNGVISNISNPTQPFTLIGGVEHLKSVILDMIQK